MVLGCSGLGLGSIHNTLIVHIVVIIINHYLLTSLVVAQCSEFCHILVPYLLDLLPVGNGLQQALFIPHSWCLQFLALAPFG
jgi:hypothetical protein